MNIRDMWSRVKDRYAILSRQDRRALVIGAVIVVPLLAWSGLVRPYLWAMEDLRDRLAAEEGLLMRERNVLQDAPNLPARLEAAGQEIARLEAGLVTATNPALAEADLTALLELLARQNRVLLQEVRAITPPTTETAPEGVLPIFLNVSGESDFEGVLEFFNGVEHHPLLMRIHSVSVEPVAEEGGSERGENARVQSGTVTFDVILEAFVAGGPEVGEDIR